MVKTPRWDLPFAGNSGQDVDASFNDLLRFFDAFSSGLILDKDLTAPPGGESEGDAYIVGASATGDWSGQDDDLAVYYYGTWYFLTPWNGLTVWVDDESTEYRWETSAWTEVTSGGGGSGNVSNTGTPVDGQLAVWTDATTIEGTSDLTFDGTMVYVGGTEVPVGTGTINQVAIWDTAFGVEALTGYSGFVYDDFNGDLILTNADFFITDSLGDAIQYISVPTASNGTIIFRTGTSSRWRVVKNADAESGSDAGSNFEIVPYDDSGVAQLTAFEIKRDDGQVIIGQESTSTLNAGADDLIIGSAGTQDTGITITDSGSSSAHRIHMRAGDNDLGFIFTEHDNTSTQHGIRIGYDDGVDEMFMLVDFREDGFEFNTKNAATATMVATGDCFALNHGESDNGMTLIAANGGTSRIYFGTPADMDQYGFIGSAASNRISVVVDNSSRYRFETAGFKQLEASAANTDDAGFGQWWVKNDTPCTPWFTDDAGNDYQLATLSSGQLQGGIWTEHPDNSKATTSGTTASWTGIPSWAKEIVITFIGVSLNASTRLLLQIGDSGGIEGTGYISRALSSAGASSDTSGFIITRSSNFAAADTLYGTCRLMKSDTTGLWSYTSTTVTGDTNHVWHGGGAKTLTAALDRFQLIASGGANTFDAGSVDVRYS